MSRKKSTPKTSTAWSPRYSTTVAARKFWGTQQRFLNHGRFGLPPAGRIILFFVCPHTLITWNSGASDNGKDPLTLRDDEHYMSPEDEAIEMVIPDASRLQESTPAALDNSLVKRGVFLRLSMGWFGGQTTRKSQKRTKELYDYLGHLEQDQSVRSMKLPLGAYTPETSAAGGSLDCVV